MVWYLYLSESPVSHLEIVCLTTFNLIASSSCESPLDFRIALMFSFSIMDDLLSPSVYEGKPVAASNADEHGPSVSLKSLRILILSKSLFIYLTLYKPCIFKALYLFCVQILCIFPCFCPYEQKKEIHRKMHCNFLRCPVLPTMTVEIAATVLTVAK